MAFDLSTAKPVEQSKKGFDISTAKVAVTPEIEAKYPYPEKPKSQPQGAGFGQYAGMGKLSEDTALANWETEKKRIDKLRDLAATNPEQADIISSMSPSERLLTGMGAGLTDIYRAASNLDQAITPEGWPIAPLPTPSEASGMKELEAVSPLATGGRVVGQALPFLPAGLASGLLPTMGGRTLGGALVGGTEGAAIASGTGGDVSTGALVGAAVGGSAEVVGTAFNRIATALVRKWFGNTSKALDETGAPTPELQAALEKEGMTVDDLAKAASAEDIATQTAKAATTQSPQRIEDLAASIEINPARKAAAERLGVEAPLATLTDQSPVQEVVGAAAAVPGSKTSESLIKYSQDLTKKAEDTIEKFSGYLDKEVVSENLKSTMQNQIKELGGASREIYSQIDELVPQSTIVNAKPLLSELAKRGSKSQKGVEGLSTVEQDVFKALQGKPTYFDIDRLRKDIGASISRTEGTYTTEQVATLKDLYSKLSQLQEGVADQIGGNAGKLWKEVKELDKKRFSLQENSEFLFGKDNFGTVMPKLESSLSMLAKGNNESFKKIISAIPPEQKGAVISGALDAIIRKSYAGDVKLDANGFAKWYNQLSRSPTNKQTLMKELPEGAEKRLDDLYLLAQGLANVTNNRVRTGAINSIFKKFDDADGIVAKLYGISDKVSESPVGFVVGPTTRVIANTAKMATKEKTPSIQAADELLASPEFRTAVLSMAEPAKKRAVAMRKLENTEAYKKYMSSQNKTRLASISALGLVPFLNGEEEDP